MQGCAGATLGYWISRPVESSGAPGADRPPVALLIPDLAFRGEVRAALQSFGNESGISVSVTVMPAESVLFALREDARTASSRFDAALIPMWALGEFIVDDLIVPIDALIAEAGSSSLTVEMPVEFPAIAALRRFNDVAYATPFDASALLLYYRSDLMGTEPASIATWDALIQTAHDLRTQSIDGVSLNLGVGSNGYANVLALLNSSIVGPLNPRNVWFHPESFRPLIDSEPFIETLSTFATLAALGVLDQANWTSAESWRHFLAGNALFTIAPVDFVRLIPASNIAESISIAPLPGSTSYSDPVTGESHTIETLNTPGNAFGSNWGGIVRSSARDPLASLLMLQSLAAASDRGLDWSVSSGLVPGQPNMLQITDDGTAPAPYLELGFAPHQPRQLSKAIESTFAAPFQFPHLRIPGTADYHAILDSAIHDVVSRPGADVAAVMAEAASSFDAVTDLLGRERQRTMLDQSLTHSTAV